MTQSIHMFLFLTSNFETGSMSDFQLQLSDCKLAVRSINIHYTIVSSLQNFYHFFSQSGVFCSLSRLVTSLIMQYNSLVFFLCICIHLCIKRLFLCINTIICDVLFRKHPFISLAIFPFLLQNILWIACISLYAAYIRRFTGCKQHSCNNYMSVLGQI